MKITPVVRAFALEQAGLRCECEGKNCRHHRGGSRCKRGLSEDNWKVYWHSEAGGATRENVEAWCNECFAANFVAPLEEVALLALAIVGHAQLAEEDQRMSITLKSVLRDVTERRAGASGGRLVYERLEDDILVEFRRGKDAIKAARGIVDAFSEMVSRLSLPPQTLCGALHSGEVTRWRTGLLVGDAVDAMHGLVRTAPEGQIVITDAVGKLRKKLSAEPMGSDAPVAGVEGELWVASL